MFFLQLLGSFVSSSIANRLLERFLIGSMPKLKAYHKLHLNLIIIY